MSFETELAFAREAAIDAGEIALRGREAAAARRKQDGTWVTDVDEAIESELRRRIAEAFPDHNILGEEHGLSAADRGPPKRGAPTWTLDPIDGTSNYLSGIPIWAILVGLRIDGASLLGVAHAPALGETYEAARGGGAYMNRQPIAVDPADKLEDATVLVGAAASFIEAGLDRFFAALVTRAQRDRGLGDSWGHLLVARGAAHAMVEAAPLPLWDVAPLEPILAEAGAVISRPSGQAWSQGQPLMTSCSSALHDALVGLSTEQTAGTRPPPGEKHRGRHHSQRRRA